jgi:hypothetical protein
VELRKQVLALLASHSVAEKSARLDFQKNNFGTASSSEIEAECVVSGVVVAGQFVAVRGQQFCCA